MKTARILGPAHLRNNIDDLSNRYRLPRRHLGVHRAISAHAGVPPFDGAGSSSWAVGHWQSPALLCSAAQLAAAAQLSSSHDLSACALPLPAQNKCEFKTFITYMKGDR